MLSYDIWKYCVLDFVGGEVGAGGGGGGGRENFFFGGVEGRTNFLLRENSWI